MMDGTVCGIDEAGRGPVIGPLVLGCVVVGAEAADELRRMGVRDSKKLSAARREELEPIVKEAAQQWRTMMIQPWEIDRLRKTMSLNVIEAEKTAKIIISLDPKPAKIIVDAADAVQENYGRKIQEAVRSLNPEYVLPPLISEHRADDTYVEVSAASVLAKVARDRAIEALKAELGDFGSGYPSDPLTKEYVKKIMLSGEFPPCVRRSWNTMERAKQASLGEYL